MNLVSCLDIQSIFSITHNQEKHEQTKDCVCESCLLHSFKTTTASWFIPLSNSEKIRYIEDLYSASNNFENTFISIMKRNLESKEFKYYKSRVKNMKMDSFFHDRTNHSLDISQITILMNERVKWFQMSSDSTKVNYLLFLLCLCSKDLLHSILSNIENNNYDKDEILFSKICSVKIPPYKSEAIIPRQSSALKKYRPRSSNELAAKDHVTFNFDSTESLRIPSRHSTISMRSISSAARCTPVSPTFSPTPLSIESFANSDFNQQANRFIDFVGRLPIHLVKKILGYLDVVDLQTACKVNVKWKVVSMEVLDELKLFQIAKEDVMVMQAGCAKMANPYYARHVPIHIPCVDSYGNVIHNKESYKIDVEVLYNEFTDINMEHCFEGLETKEVIMEEKNVYCGSYNIFIAEPHKDIQRCLSYNHGDAIAISTVDRKIRIIDVNSGECLTNISGHTASIRCVHLNESCGFVVSGSYDLTVRVWDIISGKCRHLFRGHKGTIMFVTSSRDYVYSSSSDKTVKVWNLMSGRCKRTFYHATPVRHVEVKESILLTGCMNGDIFIWDVIHSDILRKLVGHTNVVSGICVDKYHIVSGSHDGLVFLWDNIGKLEKPLLSYSHPKPVFSVHVSFCRVITGCADGKIRIWNMLNGECLRVIRGNSKNDAVLDLHISENRFVLNTLNTVLVLNFEPIKYNYSAPRDRQCKNVQSKPQHRRYKLPYATRRAQKVNLYGSPIHKEKDSSTLTVDKVIRVKSAPVKLDSKKIISRTSSSMDDHVRRVKSAHVTTNSRVNNIRRVQSAHSNYKDTDPNTSDFFEDKNKYHDFGSTLKNSSSKYSESGGRFINRRCKSAPVIRSDQKKINTTSHIFSDIAPNKMLPRKLSGNRTKKPVTTVNSNDNLMFERLTIRSPFQQREYEERLKNS